LAGARVPETWIAATNFRSLTQLFDNRKVSLSAGVSLSDKTRRFKSLAQSVVRGPCQLSFAPLSRCRFIVTAAGSAVCLVLPFAITLTFATSSVVSVEPPHPPSFLGHPLPRGERAVARWEGRESSHVTLSPRGRGWTAPGAFTSRCGPGEGVQKYVTEFMKRRTWRFQTNNE